MVAPNRLARTALQGGVTVLVAAALVGAATAARLALSPQLGTLSPFMLYVAAVLVAGLVRGAACGALVMFGGGAVGLRLFASSHGVAVPGGMLSLMIFWGVAAPVLVTANELRVQLGGAMRRLSEALERNGRIAR